MTTTTTRCETSSSPAMKRTRPRIVVGVDGSEESMHALRWALEQAQVSGEPVEPVYVFTSMLPVDFSGFAGPIAVPLTSSEELATAAEERLADCLSAVAAEAAGVAIEPLTVDSQWPVSTLVDAAAGASMLVLGVHRRHWMDGAIGSTARACLKHAPCAVVIVPAPTDAAKAVPEDPGP